MTVSRRVFSLLMVLGASPFTACAPVAGSGPQASVPVSGVPQADTAGITLFPPGYGSLRQDDLSLHIDAGTVLVRALPLDEALIRLLTPDSYRALHDLKEGSRSQIEAIARRYGGRPVSVWLDIVLWRGAECTVHTWRRHIDERRARLPSISTFSH